MEETVVTGLSEPVGPAFDRNERMYVREKGGVVMVTFVPGFVSEAVRGHYADADAVEARLKSLFPGNPERVRSGLEEWRGTHPRPRATLAQVADHVDHIRSTAGIDAIGIGSDFDGIRSTPDGLEDVARYPELLAELLRRGYSAEDLRKIIGKNVLRVMGEVAGVARRLQASRPPGEARIEADGDDARE